ncbi:glycerophosphodiester phosphodiesterase family protein [Corynebacterium gottingense]|uniref:glycerophosphodiester phosphodiesterase family protein n=1 Tax=Corynebacterium gottingense TaxID=2041036 RepID=UPI0038D17EBF
MTFNALGKSDYAHINQRLLTSANSRSPLVAVHRGQNAGSIVENTARAVRAAVVSGADIVEIDVIRSTDGEFFVFHNGFERTYFGLDRDILTLSAAEIEALQYEQYVAGRAEKYGLEQLQTILRSFPDTILNLDRSWNYWTDLLPYMDQFDCADRVFFKSPVSIKHLDVLADHTVKYPYMPIVKTMDELKEVLRLRNINTVAVELVAENMDCDLASPEVVELLHSHNLLVYLNALNLPNRVPLFVGWDDEVSVLDDPEKGWGRLN